MTNLVHKKKQRINDSKSSFTLVFNINIDPIPFF